MTDDIDIDIHEPPTIRLLVLDVDGVLTDGSIYVTDTGLEMKRFHVRDGMGIKIAQKAGLEVALLSGRSTRAVTLRAQELGIGLTSQGCSDKAAGLVELCERAGVNPEEAAMLGDDLIDLPAMARCGYPMAVADAVEEVRHAAQYVTAALGGHGAVREAIEHLLKLQHQWGPILKHYTTPRH